MNRQFSICYALIHLAVLLNAACSQASQALHTLYSKYESLCCAVPCRAVPCRAALSGAVLCFIDVTQSQGY